MGEIFNRPSGEKQMAFTGERLTSELTGQTAIEHWHRYLIARELGRGIDVLDVAAGEGYGSALLAQVARSVVGLDLAEEAIAHATASYQATNLQFQCGDARQIPLPDNSIDLVVSFETLEHFENHEAFFKEIVRVLRPDGALLMSTPDRDIYSPEGQAPNPYHVRELTRQEFESTISRYFNYIELLGQRALLGSAIHGTKSSSSSFFCFERRGDYHFESSINMARAQYLVALGANVPSWQLPSSIYVETSRLGPTDGAALERHNEELSTSKARILPCNTSQQDYKSETPAGSCCTTAAMLTRQIHSLELSCARSEDIVRELRAHLTSIEQKLIDESGRAMSTEKLLAEKQQELDLSRLELKMLRTSTSWRLSVPIRMLGRLFGRR